jgi:hypothetical protein
MTALFILSQLVWLIASAAILRAPARRFPAKPTR